MKEKVEIFCIYTYTPLRLAKTSEKEKKIENNIKIFQIHKLTHRKLQWMEIVITQMYLAEIPYPSSKNN